MKEIKIIFFDIDGTLIDMDQKQISEKMLETLIRLKEKNIILCLATGRGPTCLPSFDGIEFDAFLTFNGSYCFTKQETIFSNPIPPQDIKTIIANATSINRPVSIATKDRVASNGKDKDLVDYARIANEDVHIADDFDQVAQEDVFQIMAGSYERERWILSLQTVEREMRWKKFSPIIIWTKPRPWHLVTVITILRCFRLSVTVLP